MITALDIEKVITDKGPMSNIDKQAVTAKTKELASLMVERFSMNPVSCKLLNEAWKKEFPDEVAIAERMLALLDENIQLQREKDAIEAVALALRDDMRDAREKLEAAERRIAELEARTVNLPKHSVSEVMHMSGFSRDYAEGWCAGNDNAIHEIRAAGIKVKGE
ncbi:TPA: ead/Ea22-like family protein [Salmonella enterica subsp. enterica serovar Thompson]